MNEGKGKSSLAAECSEREILQSVRFRQVRVSVRFFEGCRGARFRGFFCEIFPVNLCGDGFRVKVGSILGMHLVVSQVSESDKGGL